MLGRRHRSDEQVQEAPVSVKAVEHARDRVTAVNVPGTVGPDDECRSGTETPDDVLQRLDRHVRVVQIFQQKYKRPPARNAGNHTRKQLEDRGPVIDATRLGDVGLGIGRCGSDVADFGEDREQVGEIGRKVGQVGDFGR